MVIEAKLFAGAKQRAGRDSITLELPESARVADLRDALAVACPDLSPWLPALMIALDCEYASDDDIIPANAEVAVIPPVSGGTVSVEEMFSHDRAD